MKKQPGQSKCHHQEKKNNCYLSSPEDREVTRQHGIAVTLRANNNNKLSDFLTIISQIITYALQNVKRQISLAASTA